MIPDLTSRQIENFSKKVDTSGVCHIWKGSKDKKGYGKVGLNDYPYLAHRVAYFIKFGRFDDSLCVLHRCDNPRCVNPDHLFLGTPKDNYNDMVSKGRRVICTGDMHGSRTKPERTCRGVNHFWHKNPQRGEDAPRHKLTTKQVLEIRERYKRGDGSFKTLGEIYGVSHTSIGHIIIKKNWRHV